VWSPIVCFYNWFLLGVINKETLLDKFVISTVECCDCEVEFGRG